jgi:hypothetical protein
MALVSCINEDGDVTELYVGTNLDEGRITGLTDRSGKSTTRDGSNGSSLSVTKKAGRMMMRVLPSCQYTAKV